MPQNTGNRKKTGGVASRWIPGAAAAVAALLTGCAFVTCRGALRDCAAVRGAFPDGQTPEALQSVMSALRRLLALTGTLTLLIPISALLIYFLLLRPLRRRGEQAAYDAAHDALTGLYNRGAYESILESIPRSPDKTSVALILFDIDHFKELNDARGHAAGDMTLRRVAEVLRRSFRAEDYICRIGGDEFAVIMTRVGAAQRAAVDAKLGRIRQALSRPADGLPGVGVSAGVAFSDAGGANSIFKDADAALYRAKNGGRGGWAFY